MIFQLIIGNCIKCTEIKGLLEETLDIAVELIQGCHMLVLQGDGFL